jgi:uncharacterized protein (TIGR02594 family)
MTMPWMDLAWHEQGQHEIAGQQANPAIVQYFAEAGHPEVTSDEVSWCAAFACAMLERAGIRSPRTLRARDFLNFGTPIDTPRVGAIAVFSRPPDPSHGHVGFVTGDTATDIVLLGGNQHDQVSVCHMPKDRLLGLRWPAPDVTAADLKAHGSRTIAHADAAIASKTGAIATGGAAVAGAQLQDQAPGIGHIAARAQELQGATTVFADLVHWAGHAWVWLAATLALYFGGKAIWHAYQVRQARTDDANTGAHAGLAAAQTGGADAAAG